MQSENLTLLITKKEKLMEILEITKKTKLSATKESVEDYINLINIRKPLFASVMQIELQLKKLGFDRFSEKCSEQLELEFQEIDKLIIEIIFQDNKNNTQIKGILDDVKKDLKEIKIGKTLFMYYKNDIIGRGSAFDKRK